MAIRLMDYVKKYRIDLARIAVALILLIITMICESLLPNVSEYVWLGVMLVAYLTIGYDVVYRALCNIVRGRIFNEFFLMSIATVGAFAIGDYPEAVAVMVFYQVGELFQRIAVDKSRKSISELMDIRPDYCNRKVGEILEVIDPFDVNIGDIIVIKSGEKVPVDCVVIDGVSSVNSSALTGESLPQDVSINSHLLSGMINMSGVLTCTVEKVFAESTASKILDLIENASSNKAKSESFISKFAKYYTPIVVLVAICLGVIPPLAIGSGWADWIYRALTFLIVSCPCALVISVPLSFFAGIGNAGQNGILVKGGNYLEDMAAAKIIVFDKTGTLTKGEFEVVRVVNVSKYDLIEVISHAEMYSSHPIARAILARYIDNGGVVEESRVSDVSELAGLGISAIVDGKQVLVGNAKLMTNNAITCEQIADVGTKLYIAIDGVYAGAVVVADCEKADSIDTIKGLKAIGIEQIVMLTGDNRVVAESIAKRLGIDTVYSELMPADKITHLDRIIKENPTKKVVFVGDGINDAPVIARADIGIAMGGVGSDSAIEASDIVLMTDEPSKIIDAIKIAKKTRKIVQENIIFSIAVKVFVLIFSALGFLNMWWAVVADVGVSVVAILNAIRFVKRK